MAETTMPTAEAEVTTDADTERVSYELAFHVLPTVVEGEVPRIFDAIKSIVQKAGGELFDEEAPQRFELAYDIEKHMEGKNRTFTSAYFGWVRFYAETKAAHGIVSEVEHQKEILRHLLIRLTHEEEANPFRFHEALKDTERKVRTVDEVSGEVSDTEPKEPVDEEKLDEALTKEEEA